MYLYVHVQKGTHLSTQTLLHTHSAQLSGIWSSKDVLFWEQLWVSHPTLVTDGETGCKYQTLYKHCNTRTHPLAHTYAHRLTLSLSVNFHRVSLISQNHVAEGRICCLKVALRLLPLPHQQLMHDHSSSDSFVKNTKTSCLGFINT